MNNLSRPRYLPLILSLILAVASAPLLAQKNDKPPAEDPEVKLGRENAKANDEQPGIKFITDAALLDRVNKIGQEIAAVANTQKVPALWGNPEVKKFNYTF